MDIIKAPSQYGDVKSPKVFLAGSIEMGIAENWQSQIESGLSQVEGTIFNPRRDDWDASWVQEKSNPQFREQVEWELAALEQADLIALYFDPATKSPISLLELGLFTNTDVRTQKIVVCCPRGFWRKGNVDIVCSRYGICQVETKNLLIEHVQRCQSLICVTNSEIT